MATTAPRQPQAAAEKAGRMTLATVTTGVIAAPVKTLVYGPEGVGKSSFAAGAPSPIFLPVEEGTNHLNVARFPQPETFQDVLDAIIELGKGEHQFRSLAIDTLDALEPLIWAAVVAEANKPDKIRSIEDFGYGKGYVAALDKWRLLFSYLEKLRRIRSMNVVLVAHSNIKKFANPEGEDFDRYELKLAGKGASGLAKEWCDNVLFATYDVVAATDDETKRTRGFTTGKRIARTVHTGAYDAKNRFSLPDPLALEWAAYREGMVAYLQSNQKPAAGAAKEVKS